MPVISEFILNLSSSTFAGLSSQRADLVIYETGISGDLQGVIDTSAQTLSAAQVDLLQAQGKTVIGYLNAAVTDHYRAYWNDAWVNFNAPNGGGSHNRDVGPVNTGAPDWLLDNANHGYAKIDDANGNAVVTFGYIVDYANTDWQARIIAEASYLVTPQSQGGLGLDGIFLDDVGRFFDAQDNDDTYSSQQAAIDMIQLVNRVSSAVYAIKPDAYITVNGGAYLDGDSGSSPFAEGIFSTFVGNVDALLMETQIFSDSWDNAEETWGTDFDFLAVEHATNSNIVPTTFVRQAIADGLIPHLAADDSYDKPAVTPQAATQGDDTITGGDGPNLLDGYRGDDVLSGLGGDDLLRGLAGADSLLGADGNDSLIGGGENDTARGGEGNDFLRGDQGSDFLAGDQGRDKIIGGPGADRLYGGADNDSIYGGTEDDFLAGSSGDDQAFGGTGNDTLLGAWGNDTLVGDAGDDRIEGQTGDDTLMGRNGADTLIGGQGADLLRGGVDTDQDRFVFDALADSGVGNGSRDLVQHFVPGTDLMDLSAIDANANAGGNQAFSFIGTAQFTTAGQLRYQTTSSHALVQADVDGDGAADFELLLLNLQSLSASDFVL